MQRQFRQARCLLHVGPTHHYYAPGAWISIKTKEGITYFGILYSVGVKRVCLAITPWEDESAGVKTRKTKDIDMENIEDVQTIQPFWEEVPE